VLVTGHGTGVGGDLSGARIGERRRKSLGVLVGAAHQDAVVAAALGGHRHALARHGAGVARRLSGAGFHGGAGQLRSSGDTNCSELGQNRGIC